MKNILLRLLKFAILFVVFGGIYFVIECIFKGKISDYRMFLLAGFVGITLGLVNNMFTFQTDFILQCIVGMLIITLAEGILGTYWTDKGLHIWDYSNLPFSAIHGQINLFFSLAWGVLSGVCIIIDDAFRYYVFRETHSPYYVIHGRLIFRFSCGKDK